MTTADLLDMPSVGKFLGGGKYQLLRFLGRGGVAVVYEAQNTWTRRRVAIKVLRPEYATDGEIIRRFMQEAQSSSQIAHPNIVDVLDMGQEPTDGTLYMVQEFLTGGNLREHLAARVEVPWLEVCDLVVPIMAALVAAHERGIVHRDIKPENIFIAKDPTGRLVPKLIDFGISKIVSSIQPGSNTQTGMPFGTPQYMSPEQVLGDRTIDGRSDVWSVGVMLYELFCGTCPFVAPTYYQLFQMIVSQTPARMETVKPALDPALCELIHRALVSDRDQRYPTMRAFLEALLAYPRFVTSGSDETPQQRYQSSLLFLVEVPKVVVSTDDPGIHPHSLLPEAFAARAAPVIAEAQQLSTLTPKAPMGDLRMAMGDAPTRPVPTPMALGSGPETPLPLATTRPQFDVRDESTALVSMPPRPSRVRGLAIGASVGVVASLIVAALVMNPSDGGQRERPVITTTDAGSTTPGAGVVPAADAGAVAVPVPSADAGMEARAADAGASPAEPAAGAAVDRGNVVEAPRRRRSGLRRNHTAAKSTHPTAPPVVVPPKPQRPLPNDAPILE